MKNRVLGLLLLALLSTACKVSIEQTTVIEADESGSATVAIALDDELRTLLETAGQDVSGFGDSFDDRFVVNELVDGEMTGIIAVAEFANLGELEEILASTPALGQAVDQISLTHEDSVFAFDASLGNVAEQIGDVAGAGDFISSDNFDDVFDISISMLLPGDMIDHNADQVAEDGMLTWNISSSSSGELSASSEVRTSITPLAIGAVIVILGLAVALFRRRRPQDVVAELT